MFTDAELLERLASQSRLCDTCHAADAQRYRHDDCPTPSLPVAALEAIEAAHQLARSRFPVRGGDTREPHRNQDGD